MGKEIEVKPRRIVDVTKPWKTQFFECREIPRPPANRDGVWERPRHGLPTNEKEGR